MERESVTTDDVLCNRCGLGCAIGCGDLRSLCGLVNAVADGGYESTPGNGHGALDDTTRYTFSLCEFCLDWLFSTFVIPVDVSDYMCPGEKMEPWAPAAERVERDSWRRMKKEFRAEYQRRVMAREKGYIEGDRNTEKKTAG